MRQQQALWLQLARVSRSKPFARMQQGLSLMEVLVSIVVLSVGLLGVAGLQVAGIQVTHGSQYRAQAALLAEDMSNRMRANLVEAKKTSGNQYQLAMTDSAPGTANAQKKELTEWLQRVSALPGGDGSVDINAAANRITVTVQWEDRRAEGATAPRPGNFTLVTSLWNN